MNRPFTPATHVLLSFALFVGAATSAAAEATKTPPPQTDAQLGFVSGNRTELLQHCKRLGIIPPAKPPIAGTNPDAATRIETAAAGFLRDAGFDVVDSADYTKAYDTFNRSIGGIYNPLTGAPRQDAATSVITNALREYFDQQHLDCVAWLRVVDEKVNVLGKTTTWEGATERVNGQPPPGGFSDFMFANGQMNGTLPAISMQVQILDRANKVLFGRRGGVQLAAYHDPGRGSGTATFLIVPRAQLLLDDKRIERALRYAIEPLRYSAQEIAVGSNDPAIDTTLIKLQDLPPVPAGVVGTEQAGLKVPREQILSAVHRVALGPLFPNDYKVPPEVAARYRTLVHEELKRLGWEVVDTDNLNAIATAAVVKSSGFYNPLTGAQDPVKVADMMKTIFAGLAMTPPPDALMTLVLLRTRAPQKWSVAEWDGAQQNALTLGPVVKGPKLFGGSSDPSAGEGSVGASALRVLLRDPANVTLYDATGGIELLQQLSLTPLRSFRQVTYQQKLTDRAPQELFQDEARDRHAVHSALRELVMTPAEITAESQPEKPKAH